MKKENPSNITSLLTDKHRNKQKNVEKITDAEPHQNALPTHAIFGPQQTTKRSFHQRVKFVYLTNLERPLTGN